MAIEFDRLTGQPGDIPRKRESGIKRDVLPLSPDTHGMIVQKIVSAINNSPHSEVEAWELMDNLDDAYVWKDSGYKIRPETNVVVAKDTHKDLPLAEGLQDAFVLFRSFNESFGVPNGERNIANVGLLINADPTSVKLLIDIKPDSKITYTLSREERLTDKEILAPEQARVIEDEIGRWGVNVHLDGQDTEMRGEFTEVQGGKLLQTLYEIDKGKHDAD